MLFNLNSIIYSIFKQRIYYVLALHLPVTLDLDSISVIEYIFRLYKYNWVVSTGEGMFCWVCVEHAPDNKRRYNFIGQPAKCIREDILKDHQKTETHVFCMGKEMEKQTGTNCIFSTMHSTVTNNNILEFLVILCMLINNCFHFLFVLANI